VARKRLSACESDIGMEIVYLIANNGSIISFEIEKLNYLTNGNEDH